MQYTRGPATKLGAVLLAVLAMQRNTKPQFGDRCVISADGVVFANLVHDEANEEIVPVYTVAEMTAEFSRLADELKLNDADRIEMFAKVKGWVYFDERVDKTLHFTKTS